MDFRIGFGFDVHQLQENLDFDFKYSAYLFKSVEYEAIVFGLKPLSYCNDNKYFFIICFISNQSLYSQSLSR